MLYYLFEYLDEVFDLPGAGLFKFLSFRAGLAMILSLVISIVIGKRIIDWLRSLQIGESVRDLGLAGQTSKAGTPTMGGIIIVAATLIPCLLLADLENVYILLIEFYPFQDFWVIDFGEETGCLTCHPRRSRI